MRVITFLRKMLHHHWPENPTSRSGLVCEMCRCGAARYVDLMHGTAWSVSDWTHDPVARQLALAKYSRDGMLGGTPRATLP